MPLTGQRVSRDNRATGGILVCNWPRAGIHARTNQGESSGCRPSPAAGFDVVSNRTSGFQADLASRLGCFADTDWTQLRGPVSWENQPHAKGSIYERLGGTA